jgi:acyl-CoA reductase-like NAD-dependent aldehyde dehydrogenase
MSESDTRLDANVQIRNPRTGEIERNLHSPSTSELLSIIQGLRVGQKKWQALGVEERCHILLQWREALETCSEKIIEALYLDTGRITESRLELQATLAGIERWAKMAPVLLDETQSSNASLPGVSIHPSFKPYPVVGVISPWNFPLLLGCIDAIPALAAGCAVLLKPSEITPHFLEPLYESVKNIPYLCDVFAMIEGAAETGELMVPNVDMICFTGSTEVGELIAQTAAKSFTPISLELGGKDPALVLPGADIARAAAGILWGGTGNAGQSCQSIERVYVHAEIYDEFIESIVGMAKKVGIGYPTLESGALGPIIAIDQVETISSQLRDAYSKGARALTGGTIDQLGGGFYMEPTILVDVNHSMNIMNLETFAPILPVMKVGSEAEAIELANSTIYGLSGCVFAATEEDGIRIARQIDAGAISINDASLTAIMHEGEKQAFKHSGIGGSRMGPASIRRFFRRQSLLVNSSSGNNPWWWKVQSI